MDYKEPKKRVTKSDKKSKKPVYSKKHIRIKSSILENKRYESVFYEHTPKSGDRVCKSGK
jgi:hypothetical protein